jgi:hypothetical protein
MGSNTSRDSRRDVVPARGGTWEVRAPGASRASAVAKTKSEAIERAREIVANRGGGSVLVHSETGEVLKEHVAQVEHGSVSFLRMAADLKRAVQEIALLPDSSGPGVPPDEDPVLRLHMWTNLYKPELDHVFNLRNQLVHSPQGLDQAAVDEGLSFATRLLDVLTSLEVARDHPGKWVALRGFRVVDADSNLSSLLSRVGESRETRVVFQEPLVGEMWNSLRFAFSAAGASGIRRPVVDVRFGGLSPKFPCLVDSGALGIRAGTEIADILGLDLSAGHVGRHGIGGAYRLGWTLTHVELRVGRWSWEAPVTFFEDFNHQPVLGLEGFFDRFAVTIDTARAETRIVRL